MGHNRGANCPGDLPSAQHAPGQADSNLAAAAMGSFPVQAGGEAPIASVVPAEPSSGARAYQPNAAEGSRASGPVWGEMHGAP